ncbi:MAG TPA: fumarate reductase/succinate dehydrogenase flavoprotein subunit [Polyangiaceae bacterium]|nr:fumarate reductase/succinate dehydrogenase flavoprotein subunit [Polyangiaceae bacterium]
MSVKNIPPPLPPGSPAPSPQPASPFGSPVSPLGAPGAPAAAASFGAGSREAPPGAPAAPSFGAPPAPSFGAPPAPSFGAPPAPAFGTPPPAPAFGGGAPGAPGAPPAFGANAPGAPPFGGGGPGAPPGFGGGPPGFGAAPPGAPGGYGPPPGGSPGYGPAPGAPFASPLPPPPGFPGSPSQPPPAFGAPSMGRSQPPPAPGFSPSQPPPAFGAPPAPAFGTPPPPPAFGAQQPSQPPPAAFQAPHIEPVVRAPSARPLPELDAKIPSGPLEKKWDKHRFDLKLVNPANKRKYTLIVVGSGLAGGSAAATLSELGYKVKCFCYQDSPRRAHSIAAQGGINAAKNYQNDGDSIYRLFYDTVKGGDFRAREANVYRLAQVSVNIIDQCAAQGVPFAREYGGVLANRSFGGAQVSRTFYARGQTGQQLLLGAYQALEKEIGKGNVQMFPRHEMLDLVLVDGKARGIVTRDMATGRVSSHVADAVILATGGYGNVFYLSTNAKGCNVTATYRAYKKGAAFGNPCFTQIHPTCIPVSGNHQSKLTLMSESLRNDGRVWVSMYQGDRRPPDQIPEEHRDYYLERKYPSFGNLAPRDIASRAAKEACDQGRGVGPGGLGVYLDFSDAIKRLGKSVIAERYGNLFEMYQRITDEDPYKVPMRIYPAVHYTMGGLWVDYNLMSTIPGLFVLGEANFSDHGANRLGASALMQGLADGYFIIPYTIGNYLAANKFDKVDEGHPSFRQSEAEVITRTRRLLSINGRRSVTSFHRDLGKIMWDHCGMARNEAGLQRALQVIPQLREEFWHNVSVTGGEGELNQQLEMAGRVADFLEFGELMCLDALHRKESCGGHFREESQTPDGEALRDDQNFAYVAAWAYQGDGVAPKMLKEPLVFENVALTQRSYK